MSPTIDAPLVDHEPPVFMLPDGTVLPSIDAHGRPIGGFNGLMVGTGPGGEIVIKPSDWSGETTVELRPLSELVDNAESDSPTAPAGETTTAVAQPGPVPTSSPNDLLTTVFVSVAVLALVVAVVLGAASWRHTRRS
ncbi:hypothetical protein RDE2_53180 (plasmid) [Rhodococcus sp. RDE2]|nr:hypothetical protein RDE2_53180 [Rhodococcus sp. RDE2]